MLARDRLGVELYAEPRVSRHVEALHDVVLAHGRDTDRPDALARDGDRSAPGPHREGVIAGRERALRDTGEDRVGRVTDGAAPAVPRTRRGLDDEPETAREPLVPEAHAEDRQLTPLHRGREHRVGTREVRRLRRVSGAR